MTTIDYSMSVVTLLNRSRTYVAIADTQLQFFLQTVPVSHLLTSRSMDSYPAMAAMLRLVRSMSEMQYARPVMVTRRRSIRRIIFFCSAGVNSSSSVLVRSAISSMPSTAGGFSSVYDIVPAQEAAVEVRVPDEDNEERGNKYKTKGARSRDGELVTFISLSLAENIWGKVEKGYYPGQLR